MAASATPGVSAPGPRRAAYVRVTALVRAARTASGAAIRQLSGTYRATMSGLKLWKAAVVSSAPAGPSGAARQAK